MWMLSFIPDSWLYQAVIAVMGIGATGYLVGTFGGFIPGIKTASALIKGISTLVLIAGVYFFGSYSTEMKWRAEAAKLKADMDRKVALSEKNSKQVVTKYITKTKVVKEKGDVIIKKVTEYVNKDADAKCVVPKSFVVLHDSAAKNEVPDSSQGIDGTASSVKLSTIGETVTINYNNYHQLSERLKALQDWVAQQEKIYNGN
jgi:hypothetical protein